MISEIKIIEQFFNGKVTRFEYRGAIFSKLTDDLEKSTHDDLEALYDDYLKLSDKIEEAKKRIADEEANMTEEELKIRMNCYKAVWDRWQDERGWTDYYE